MKGIFIVWIAFNIIVGGFAMVDIAGEPELCEKTYIHKSINPIVKIVLAPLLFSTAFMNDLCEVPAVRVEVTKTN